MHSTRNSHGIGELTEDFDGPILEHGYAGGAHDRIALSENDPLKNIESMETALESNCFANRNRVVVTPPEYMCIIRSGQNWTFCDDEERNHYLTQLHPVLIEGMDYLRDNPFEANCYSMRFIDKTNNSWQSQSQTFGLGFAPDIYTFENWAKSHPKHLAIFDGFLQMVQKFGEQMKLQLWHEVVVLPDEDCEFEYIGCHSKTGLLPYI